MGKASREKGKRGERELASALREAFPAFADSIKRGWQTRIGCDDPDVCGLPGFWLEHKSGLRPNIRAAYKQARADSKKKVRNARCIPMAVIQDDFARDRLCIVGFEDMIRILRAAYGFDPVLSLFVGEAAE